MAAKKAKKRAATQAPAEDEMPSGFSDETEPDIDGWVYPEPGTIVHGKLVSAFRIEDEGRPPRDVLLVKLRRPVEEAKLNGSQVTVEVGEILAVGVSHKLKKALSYVEHHGEIWAKYLGKKDIGHGQTMWMVETGFKGKRSAPPARMGRNPSGGDDDYGPDDDIPF